MITNEEFMMKGFTPFCIHEESRINLIMHKRMMAQIKQLCILILEKEQKIENNTNFGCPWIHHHIANMYGLAKVLFYTTSPLMIRLQELQKLCWKASKMAIFSKSVTSNQTGLHKQCGKIMNAVTISL